MKLQFISPISLKIISGGNLYNSAIIEGLRQQGMSIDYNFTPKKKAYDITIIDSLAMNKINPNQIDHSNQVIIALIHQLPELSETCMKFYRDHAKFLVTGVPTKDKLIQLFDIDDNLIHIIRPGIPDYWQPKTQFKEKPNSFIIVSNFIEQKGYEMLIKVLKHLEHLNLKFDIVGNNELDGKYAEHIIALINGINVNVKFHFNLRPRELYHQLISSDAFLSLSKSESFGMAIYEALATGLPCLSYKTGDFNYFSNYLNYIGLTAYSEHNFSRVINEWINHPSKYKSHCNLNLPQPRIWQDVVDDVSIYLNTIMAC